MFNWGPLKPIARALGLESPGAGQRLETLVSLSATTAPRDLHNSPPWRELLSESCRLAEQADTYCSVTLLKDMSDPRSTGNDSVQARWRLDFSRPNRYHVTQWLVIGVLPSGEPEIGVSEWVFIGDEYYDGSALWVHGDPGGMSTMRRRLNRMLSLDSALDLLAMTKAIEPVDIYACTRRPEHYVVLEYDMPPPCPDSIFFDPKELPWHLQVWVNESACALTKIHISLQGTPPDGHFVELTLQRVFACYNEPVRVEPPPWVNAIPAASGNFTIVSNKLPILRHYD